MCVFYSECVSDSICISLVGWIFCAECDLEKLKLKLKWSVSRRSMCNGNEKLKNRRAECKRPTEGYEKDIKAFGQLILNICISNS